MQKQTHTIDATNRILGRLAAEIAVFLRGKHRPDFAPYKDAGDLVVVKNVDKIKFTGQKMKNKKYYRHSGYLGGLKTTTLEVLFNKDPRQVLRQAVWGMLPKNRLRAKQIKRLKFDAKNQEKNN